MKRIKLNCYGLCDKSGEKTRITCCPPVSQKDPTPRTSDTSSRPQKTHLKRNPVKKSSGHSFGLGVGSGET